MSSLLPMPRAANLLLQFLYQNYVIIIIIVITTTSTTIIIGISMTFCMTLQNNYNNYNIKANVQLRPFFIYSCLNFVVVVFLILFLICRPESQLIAILFTILTQYLDMVINVNRLCQNTS